MTKRYPDVTKADWPLLNKLSNNHCAALLATGSYADRSVLLNIPLGTVKSRINRARIELAKLREMGSKVA